MTQSDPAKKYLFKPFYGSSHWWALNIMNTAPRECSVLDVGSGAGKIGQALQELGFSNLFAVEIDDQARKEGAQYYRDSGRTVSHFEGRSFDYILLLDILEHLPDSKKFLDSVLEVASPGTKLLISVPNVAHWSVRLPLLFGFFEYTERGLLDRTHLSLFTRRSFHRLLKADGQLSIRDASTSIAPFEFLVPDIIANSAPFKLCSKFRLALAQLLPGLLGYQQLALVELMANNPAMIHLTVPATEQSETELASKEGSKCLA